MEFYTMQLRSVDEGSTVFYDCPKCGHTFRQNN
jgi:DNA-directed RNA polymerase I subunit RPA12